MKQLLKQIIKKNPLYYAWRNWRIRRRQFKELADWERNGKPVPPPHLVKQRVLQSYCREFDLKILVETGTYYGDMVEAMKGTFDYIYSIELSKELHEKASRRFKGVKHIELLYGDSGTVLGEIMSRLDKAALFWLDGHYSAGVTAKGDKDTPIFEELKQILDAPNRGHVIIIDDARSFGRDQDYPSIEELSDYILSKRPNLNIVIQDDNIRITPKQ